MHGLMDDCMDGLIMMGGYCGMGFLFHGKS